MKDETGADTPPNPQRFGALKGILPDISVEEWEETDRAIAHMWEINPWLRQGDCS